MHKIINQLRYSKIIETITRLSDPNEENFVKKCNEEQLIFIPMSEVKLLKDFLEEISGLSIDEDKKILSTFYQAATKVITVMEMNSSGRKGPKHAISSQGIYQDLHTSKSYSLSYKKKVNDNISEYDAIIYVMKKFEVLDQ